VYTLCNYKKKSPISSTKTNQLQSCQRTKAFTQNGACGAWGVFRQSITPKKHAERACVRPYLHSVAALFAIFLFNFFLLCPFWSTSAATSYLISLWLLRASWKILAGCHRLSHQQASSTSPLQIHCCYSSSCCGVWGICILKID